MKNSETLSKNLSMLKNQTEYYKNLGEKAAIYTFTKNSLSQRRMSPITHRHSKLQNLKDEPRKSDLDTTPMLSPLSRDISHLRDKFQIPFSTKPNDLPSDIKSLKKLLETPDHAQSVAYKLNSLPFTYKKDLSLENLQKGSPVELPSIDRLSLGPPSGRQEINNLKKWFEFTKELPEYEENEENKKTLHLMCCKELIRQVSVHCIERGELLHDVMDYFIAKIEKHSENLNVAMKNTEKIKKVVVDDFKIRECELRDRIERLEIENLQFREEILDKNKEIYQLKKEIEKEKEIFEEWRVKLGFDDTNSFKGFRVMHKSTNVVSKGRDSVFRFTLNQRGRNDVPRAEVGIQTETTTYTRMLPKGKKVKKESGGEIIVNEEIKIDEVKVDEADEGEEKGLKSEENPQETQEKNEIAAENTVENTENPQKTEDFQVITICDQECQTFFSLETIFYDYIEANVCYETDSLGQYEEDLDDRFSEITPSKTHPEDDPLYSEIQAEEPNRIKTSPMPEQTLKLTALNLEADSESIFSEDKNSSKNKLEVIPDKNSSEEKSGANKSSQKSKERNEEELDLKYSYKVKDKNEELAYKSAQGAREKNKKKQVFKSAHGTREKSESPQKPSKKRQTAAVIPETASPEANRNRRKSNLNIKPLLESSNSKRQRSSSPNLEIKISEPDPRQIVTSNLQDAHKTLKLLEVAIQEKRSKLTSLKEKISKKKAVLNSLSNPSPNNFRKFPSISIKELKDSKPSDESSSLENIPVTKQDTHEINSNDSISIESEAPNLGDLGNDLRRSYTINFLSPKGIKRNSVNESTNLGLRRSSSRSVDPERLANEEEGEEEESGSKSFDGLIENLVEEKLEKFPRRSSRKLSGAHLTEFVLFQFGKKGIIKEQIKKNPAKKLVAAITTKKESWLRKNATTSRKMANKFMSAAYLSYAKTDTSYSLCEFFYDEFLGRYGIKKVADRKFTEFICSLFTFDDSKRAKTFLRFIGAGSLVSASNFSEDSLKFYLDSLNFMINSKVGIMVYDDTLDKIMFPLARANECVKEKLLSFDRAIVNRVTQKFEKFKMPDAKKINSLGMIEGEIVLETLTEVFENAREHILQGVELLLGCLKYGENKEKLERFEVFMIFRKFCPGKIEDAEQFLLGKDSVGFKEFFGFCLEKGCCNVNTIYHVVPDEKNSLQDVWSVVGPGVESLGMILDEIKAAKNVAWNEPFEFWEGKLNRLLQGAVERNPYESLLAFKIYSDELLRLRSMSN